MNKLILTFLFAIPLFCLGTYAQCTLPADGTCQFDVAGDHTVTVTQDIVVRVHVWGAGGAGGQEGGNNKARGGGGGGAYSRGNSVTLLAANSPYTATVGLGGEATTNHQGGYDPTHTEDGGISSFEGISAEGGQGAEEGASPGRGGNAGAGAGDVKFSGAFGGARVASNNGLGDGGGGGGAGGATGDGSTGSVGPDEMDNNAVAAGGGGGSGNPGGGSGGTGGDTDNDDPCTNGPCAAPGNAPGGGGGGKGSGSAQSGNGSNGRVVIQFLSLLPVELVYFDANLQGKEVLLTWQTASELNNEKFILESGTDGRNFKSIGEVKGSGTSDFTNEYHFNDKNPLLGVNYYRLKQVDFDGTFSYSEVTSVTVQSSKVSRVLSNPVADELTIVQSQTTDEVQGIFIFNALGELIKSTTSAPETITTSIPVSDLASGHYYVEIRGKSSSETHKWFKL